MSAIFFGFLSAITYGISNTLMQEPSKKLGSNGALIIRGIFTSLLLLPALLFFPINTKGTIAALAIGIYGYIPVYFFYKAIRTGKVGVVLAIANCSVVISILLAVIFLGETISPIQAIAIIVILIGLATLSINPKEFKQHDKKTNKAAIYASITAVGWGILWVIYKWPLAYIDPYTTSLFAEIGVLIAAITIYSMNSGKLVHEKTKDNLKLTFISGIFVVIGSITYLIGINLADISLIAPAAATAPIFGAIASHTINKEVLTKKELAGIVITVAGLILISL